MKTDAHVPQRLKIGYTLFTAILVIVYWFTYGPQNFLWLSDIGLFLTVLALWLESPLLMSICAVGILPLELLWNFDFFAQLFTQSTVIGLSAYMFNADLPLYLRAFSLFHVFLPIIWLWYLRQWGYAQRALPLMTVLIWILLPASYLLTEPYRAINWVFAPALNNWHWMPPTVWVLILMIGFPLIVFLPTHLLLKKICKSPSTRP